MILKFVLNENKSYRKRIVLILQLDEIWKGNMGKEGN